MATVACSTVHPVNAALLAAACGAAATEAFTGSSVARAAFGDDVVDHYAHFHEVEVGAFDTSVTDWERSRYFERI